MTYVTPRLDVWKFVLVFIVGYLAGALDHATYVADAAPLLCAHRGAEHAAQHHESREADSRWHVMHGDLPTCNLDKPDDVDDRDHERDDPRWRLPHDEHKSDDHEEDHADVPHRDRPGFHCTWRGCG